MFEGKKILITGGTGSLGTALTQRLLTMGVDAIRIFSRNEEKQIQMESKFSDDRLRFLLGDIRDFPRLLRALDDVDFVFHAAALKHVPKIEYNPFEAIKTNVIGSQNVIEACVKNHVKKAICIGTDKAVSPLNTYGATKLLMEKLFVSANNYLDKEKHPTQFIAVRYGNVLGSSGSVVPKFIEQIRKKTKLSITDAEMTRFSITMSEALDFVLKAIEIGKGSEIFVPKLKAYSIIDIKNTLCEILEDTGHEEVGIRPGEKLHEVLINSYEMEYTWEIDNMFMIHNPFYAQFYDDEISVRYPSAKKLQNKNIYSSNTVEKITVDELKQIFMDSNLI